MQANVTLKIRDATTGEVVGENTTTALVLENGRHFVIPHGYLPGLAEAPAADVRIEITPLAQQVAFAEKVVTNDEHGNTILSLVE